MEGDMVDDVNSADEQEDVELKEGIVIEMRSRFF